MPRCRRSRSIARRIVSAPATMHVRAGAASSALFCFSLPNAKTELWVASSGQNDGHLTELDSARARSNQAKLDYIQGAIIDPLRRVRTVR